MTTKTVLITGGNRGLGQALVERFAKTSTSGNTPVSWTVLATARSIDSLSVFDETVLPRANRYALDLASHDSVVALSTALVERCNNNITKIDVIIHNAGFNPKDIAQNRQAGYFESTFYYEQFSAQNVMESMLINALHPMELTGRLASILAPSAAVIAISSWLGSIGEKTVPGHYGYTGSKALLNMCIKGLSLEFAKEQNKESGDTKSNRVAIAINPGWMQTDMGGGARADISPLDVADRLHHLVLDDKFVQQHNGHFINIVDRSEHAW